MEVGIFGGNGILALKSSVSDSTEASVKSSGDISGTRVSTLNITDTSRTSSSVKNSPKK